MIQPLRARASAFGLRRAILPILWLSLLGCNGRSADVREWRASDHDQNDSPGKSQTQVDPKAQTAPAVPGLEDVTLVAWSQNCTPCHGELGRGDGPRGPMLKATNLSDPAWQQSRTDQDIAKSIKLGKGAMPAFNLPDTTIANLVRLVRMMNAAQLQAHANAAASAANSAAAAAAASAAPSSSAGKAAPKASAAVAPKPSAAVAAPKPTPAPAPTPP
ncbi:MAG TPA: cytochrome c [Polyangiaceae bacterium]|nr:cytochrome c [Polyangiaceae bacterium]